MSIPTDDKERKEVRLSLLYKLFPDACVALSQHIQAGGDKYCGGEPRWDRSKSPEEIESLLRHVFEQVHNPTCVETAQAIAWRAMANLQKVREASSPETSLDNLTLPSPSEAEACIPTHLAEFLRSEGCLDEYVVEHEGCTAEWFGSEGKGWWIEVAFAWNNTPSGSTFWDTINNKWQAHLEQMNKEDA